MMGSRATPIGTVVVVLALGLLAASSCGIDTSGLAAAVVEDGGARPHDATSSDARGGSDTGSDSGSRGDGDMEGGDASSDGPSDANVADVQQEADAEPPADVASEPPPPPTCTGCAANQCCSNGACVNVSNNACGNGDQACIDCTAPPGSLTGNQCIMPQGKTSYVCGCFGPGSPDQCPAGNACHSQQCGTSCDGQHPCNGGCCSGNDLASSTCVADCGSRTCMNNYCQ